MNALRLRKLAAAVSAAVAMTAMHSAQGVVVDTLSFTADPIVIVWGADAVGAAAASTQWAADLYLLTAGVAPTVGGSHADGDGDDLIGTNVYPVLTGTGGLSAIPAAGSATPYGDIVSPSAGGVWTDAGTTGVLDAADSYTPFGITLGTTDVTFNAVVTHGFFVASNTAFDLMADVQAPTVNTLGAAASDVMYGMRIVPADATGATHGIVFGTNAQHPHSGGDGITYDSPGVLTAANLIALGNDLATVDASAASQLVFDGDRRTAASVGTISTQSVLFLNDYAMDYDLSMGTGEFTLDVHYTVYNP